MRRIVLAAVIAGAGLAACGGGGGGTSTVPPSVTPTPTVGPRTIQFAWSGAAHSRTSAFARHALATISGTEPIAIGAPANPGDPNDPAIIFGQSAASVTAKEVDASGSPVPNAQPSFAVTSAAIAQVTSVPQPSATPIVQVSAQSAGSTTTTVTFPDGLSGSVTTNVYQTLHPSCPSNLGAPNQPTGYRYDAASAKIVPTTSIAAADLYLTGPACPGEYAIPGATSTVVHTPAGYQQIAESTPMGSVLAVLTFTPTGTSFDLAQPFGTPFWIVRTATNGVYLKVRTTGIQCSGAVQCGTTEIDAVALASNTSGVFAF